MKITTYLLLSFVACGCAQLNVHPPGEMAERPDVVGAWFGFEDGFAHAYRLRLNADGTGMFARHYYRNGGDLTVYRISHWGAAGVALNLTIVPDGSNTISASGLLGPEYIKLVVKADDWSHTAILNKEGRVEHELEILRSGTVRDSRAGSSK